MGDSKMDISQMAPEQLQQLRKALGEEIQLISSYVPSLAPTATTT